MNTKRLAAGLVFALSVVCPAAHAQVNSILFQDDDIDFLLDSNLQPKSGDFAEGDVLVSVFELAGYTINGVDQIGAGNEITGIAVLEIASIIGDTVAFQPYTGGFNAVSPVDVINGDAGTTIAVWRNSTADFNLGLDLANFPAVNCLTLAQCLDEASAGSLVQVDGFGGDPNEFWVSTSIVDGAFNTDTVLGTGGGTNVATFNAAQTTFFHETGPVSDQDVQAGTPCVGMGGPLGCVVGPVFTGTISGGGGVTPINAGLVADGAFARSDVDGTKIQVVPEPGILTLVGMALLGLAATRRRRK